MRVRRLLAPLLVCALACGSAMADAPASASAAASEAAAAPLTVPATEAAPAPAPRVAPGRAPVAQPAAPAYAPAPVGSLMKTLLSLTLVLGLLAGLAWLLKRFGPQTRAGAGGLRIVGALNLGGRERIMVVEIGDQWIVVGASPGRVSALATMPKQEGGPAQVAAHADAAPATSFSAWLKQTIEQRNAK